MLPLRDTEPSKKFPIATILIIIINILVFLYQVTLPEEQALAMIYNYAFIPKKFISDLGNYESYIPLFTSMFLHGNLMHLVSNMWSLWLFGDNVEDKTGAFRFVIFYLLTGLIAGFAQFIFSPMSNVPTVGASGAIAGVMGAYFLIVPHAKILTLIPFIPFFVKVPAPIFLIIWFISQLRSGISGTMAGIAWWAHIFGFLAGFFIIKKFIRKKKYYYYS